MRRFHIHPASVAHIRKILFDLLAGTSQEAALATSCLTDIDVLRDEYGIAANDARHPDVMSEARGARFIKALQGSVESGR